MLTLAYRRVIKILEEQAYLLVKMELSFQNDHTEVNLVSYSSYIFLIKMLEGLLK